MLVGNQITLKIMKINLFGLSCSPRGELIRMRESFPSKKDKAQVYPLSVLVSDPLNLNLNCYSFEIHCSPCHRLNSKHF